MTNLTPEDLTIGYCTNVHAGVDLPAIRENLDKYAVAVRDEVHAEDQGSLGVGLWIPDQASRELVTGTAAVDFAGFLSDRQLSAFTINGFPYDNFHQDVVKHRVYLPTWCQRERLEYTQRLAEILVAILPDEQSVGSISTLPIGWPNNPHGNASDNQDRKQAGVYLRELAKFLEELESRAGRQVLVAIEPEPGCVLDTTADMIEFFDSELPEKSHRRYLTVCHDICHSAVMMEPQREVIGRLADAGIGIGKVQVSSAVSVDWAAMADERKAEALQQLSDFAEDRYLHQTGRSRRDGEFDLVEDLPSLIAKHNDQPVDDLRWIVHFHVPIFIERFGHLGTSQHDVLECLRTLLGNSESSGTSAQFSGHLEIETYAWTVLPEEMRKRGLAEDIASEFQWLIKAIEAFV